VASGWEQVLTTTSYSGATGYGWTLLAGSDYSGVWRPGVGDDMESDFIKGEDGAFRVDLPSPGTYEVTLTLGDLGGWPSEQTISINGVFQETVSTADGELVTVSYEVEASSGYVIVELEATLPRFKIHGLEVASAGPDTFGPSVTDHAPSGQLTGSVDRVTFTFNEAIEDGSFDTGDVASFDGPSGPVAVSEVNKLSDTSYEVVFASQTEVGAYTMTIGPAILDTSDNEMNQDADGTNGEVPDDQYTATFELVEEPPVPTQFDFGTGASPVASGWEQVLTTTSYSGAAGYGWTLLAGSDYSGVWRSGVGDDMESDFIKGEDGAFRVDLPSPGTCTVTLTLGDLGGWPSQQAISINGAYQETVTTADGELVTVSYEVEASSGYVIVELEATIPRFKIHGLEIAAV
jgi:hypothetical protein